MSSNSNPSPSSNNQGYSNKSIKILTVLGGGAAIVTLLLFALNRYQKPQQLPSTTQAPNIPNSSTTPVTPTPKPPTTPVNPAPEPPTTSILSTPEQTQVEVYYIASSDTSARLRDQKVSVKNDLPNQILQSAFEHLLEQPSQESLKSTIPQGTKLYSVKSQDNEVYVNLSQEFETGGGSSSMSCRLGQVIYTATALNNEANIWIQVEGKLLPYIGGEGLMVHDEDLSTPLTRKTFRENYSCQ